MKNKQALYVYATNKDGKDRSQYLKTSEVRLINTMLKEGLSVRGVYLRDLTAECYKSIFG